MAGKKVHKTDDRLVSKVSKSLPLWNITIISGRIQRQAGIDVPEKFDIVKVVKELGVKITGEPTYILWNDGEPVANETGGTDCIAKLYLQNGEIRGWSV